MRTLVPTGARTAARTIGSALVVLVLTGCGPTSFLITPVSPARGLAESVLVRESVWAHKKIALIDVDGELRNTRDASLLGMTPGENPVSLFKEKLDRAAGDKRVQAVVLRINSPGGGVTASDLMYAELCRFRKRSGKSVVACMLDVAASGGYYLACGADRIIAHPTTVTGSIGVIMVTPDFSGTMRKLGIRANIFKSGELKDAGSPFREMNKSDQTMFTTMIDRMYARFVEVVAKGRKLDEQHVRELADGRVYLAAEAKEYGLIDQIGTLHDAIAAAKSAAGLADQAVLIVQYARPLGHRPNVYAHSSDGPTQVNLVNVEVPRWLRGSSPQFLYLWAPGW